MFALMKPSSVATRSKIRGTSFGVTVVTRTSGAFAATWAGLREQPESKERKITRVVRTVSCFIVYKVGCESRLRALQAQSLHLVVPPAREFVQLIALPLQHRATLSSARCLERPQNQRALVVRR